MSAQLDRLLSPGPRADATVAYGSELDQVYDVHRPATPRGVTVLLVHGGFWRPAYHRAHTAHQADALARHGFHVATVEYRRPPRAGWPTIRDDLLAVTGAVRTDHELPRPVLTMGHSAGGHLVLWLQHQPIAAGFLGTLALAPCADLARTHDLALGDDAALALMGSRPAQAPEAWALADPARLGRPVTPTVLLHGDVDDVVPLEVSRAYCAAVDASRAELQVVTGAGHYDLIDPQSPHFARVLEATASMTRA